MASASGWSGATTAGESRGPLAQHSANPRRSSSGSAAGSGSNATSDAFPAGNWTFGGALAAVSTACASDPATFSCWPLYTYNTSSPHSLADLAFEWTVSRGANNSLALASYADPVALTFGSTPLALAAAGTPDEHYSFSLVLDKWVHPAAPRGGQQGLAGCWFNGTTLAGHLYTRRPAAGATTTVADQGSAGWPQWQFAFDINQTVPGGPATPNCYVLGPNNTIGAPITQGLAPQPTSATCGCFWRNYSL